jgi:pyruvate kinase
LVNITVLDYEIIATLGPCSETIHAWESMSSAGVTGFRLNTSHLTLLQLYSWLEKLHPFLASSGLKLVLDLQGSKWRLGSFIHTNWSRVNPLHWSWKKLLTNPIFYRYPIWISSWLRSF